MSTGSKTRRPRGRPPKIGTPQSAAERMRAYRQRRKAAGVVVRQFSHREQQEFRTLQYAAARRQRFEQTLAQAVQLKEEYERLEAENKRLQHALAEKATRGSPQKSLL